MGLKHIVGKWVPKDDAAAAKWFKKAAEKGRKVAVYCVLYNNGSQPQKFHT
jgi:TPR repeat protein